MPSSVRSKRGTPTRTVTRPASPTSPHGWASGSAWSPKPSVPSIRERTSTTSGRSACRTRSSTSPPSSRKRNGRRSKSTPWSAGSSRAVPRRSATRCRRSGTTTNVGTGVAIPTISRGRTSRWPAGSWPWPTSGTRSRPIGLTGVLFDPLCVEAFLDVLKDTGIAPDEVRPDLEAIFRSASDCHVSERRPRSSSASTEVADRTT
jgi:hypothetical protein